MEGHTQGHIKRNNETFYFVCPKSAIFVPDTQKYPSSRLIHLRYVTKNSLKNKEKTLDYIGRDCPVSKATLFDSRIKKYAYCEPSEIYRDIGASPDGLPIEQIEGANVSIYF